jgi:hypothetical protein
MRFSARSFSARRYSVLCATGLLCSALSAFPSAAQQSTAAPPAAAKPGALSLADIRALAEAQIAIAAVLDSNGAQLAKVKNKTVEAQAETQKKRQELIEQALTKRGLTTAEFERRRYIVSTDRQLRFQLDSVVAKMTGQPLPGTVILAAGGPPGAGAAAGPAPAAPPFPTVVGIMIGYVGSGYLDTPDKSGLLPMAVTEAKIAAQHAGFMARSPDSLRILQMHAGHVLHAIDPTTMPAATAPGKGYGVKRALQGAITYAEQAAKEVGASANVKTHSAHIAGAARSALERADLVIAMARRIQTAKDAKTAASLIGELQSLCDQLTAGVDVNADGRVAWNGGEGGIQQAQDHVTLLINGEKKP